MNDTFSGGAITAWMCVTTEVQMNNGILIGEQDVGSLLLFLDFHNFYDTSCMPLGMPRDEKSCDPIML